MSNSVPIEGPLHRVKAVKAQATVMNKLNNTTERCSFFLLASDDAIAANTLHRYYLLCGYLRQGNASTLR